MILHEHVYKKCNTITHIRLFIHYIRIWGDHWSNGIAIGCNSYMGNYVLKEDMVLLYEKLALNIPANFFGILINIPSTTSTDLLDGPQYMTHLIFSSVLWDGTNLRSGFLASIKA